MKGLLPMIDNKNHLITEIFFQLLRVDDGRRSSLDNAPTAEQWQRLFEMAQEQTLIGICADAIELLPIEQRPPRNILMKWVFLTAKIEQRNIYLNGQAQGICKRLNNDGFAICLLKGLSVAAYYPNPLRRQSGDLDIWAVPEDITGAGRHIDFRRCRRQVVEYAHRHSPDAEICLHNIVFPVIRDVSIELHFIPFCFNSYLTARRFRMFLRKHYNAQFTNIGAIGVPCPTDGFNMVFLLAHIFRHFLLGGVGLRQVMDYYYLVMKWGNDGKLGDKKLMSGLLHDLESLGLLKFCGAMMWVLGYVFGLEKEKMIVSPDERQGQLLLTKIMSGGNFGQYMKDNPFECKPNDGHLVKFYKRTRIGMQMFWHYPSECIWNSVRIIEMFFILRFDRMKTR